MINFKLDPPSGYADSYTDIRFIVNFDKADRSEIRLFNVTSNIELEIIGVNNGYILGETVAITDQDHIDGYINIFNRDKMNVGLRNLTSVDIKFEVTQGDNKTEGIVTFYNQSKSIDGGIIPFDLVVPDKNVDIENNKPVQFHIVSDTEKLYELCVRTEDGSASCTFEIYARKGTTSFFLPSEVLYFDLDLEKNHGRDFYVYWVKFEGVNYMKFMNRIHILIDDTKLSFNARKMTPKSQARKGPTGIDLSDDFALSFRYFVHTSRQFTSVHEMVSAYGPQQLLNITRFLHESQNLQAVSQSVQTFADSTNITEIHEAYRSKALLNSGSYNPSPKIIRARSTPERREFLSHASKVYRKQQEEAVEILSASSQPSPPKKSKGCGCSRK